MTADVTALRALLPELEAAGDRLEFGDVGRLVAAFYGINIVKVTLDHADYVQIHSSSPKGILWDVHRNRCPDVDLTAADRLVSEILPGWHCVYSRNGELPCTAKLFLPGRRGCAAHHDSSIALAILIALTRAVIAQAEQDADPCDCCGAPASGQTDNGDEMLCSDCMDQRADEIGEQETADA